MIYLLKPAGITHGRHYDLPTGLLSLAGTLKTYGIPSKVIDLKLSPMPELSKGDIVGVTCFTPSRQSSFEVCRRAKEQGATVVLGGPHATLMKEQIVREYPFIDEVCVGDGEAWFLKYVSGIEVHYPTLDDYPLPDWEQVSFTGYPSRYPRNPNLRSWNGVSLRQQRIPIILGRGCIGRCSFCSVAKLNGHYRNRSSQRVMEEIRLLDSLGQHHFFFADDCFSANMRQAKQLCRDIYASGIKIAWSTQTRVDCVDEELLHLMRDAGCYIVLYGIESADPQVSTWLGKPYNEEKSVDAIRLTKNAGMLVGAMFIETPWDTDKTRRLNDEFCELTEPHYRWSTGGLWIFPGTPLYEDMKARGVIDDSFWLGNEPHAKWK
jgi:anaerobic magnesium-protoporphyrin IX monomethyl ester cyclase